MSDIKLSGGDLEIVNGEVDWVTGIQAIRQNIETRVRSWFGENAYDQTLGTPWAQVFFGRDSTDAERKLAIEATIRTVRGVDAVAISSIETSNGICTIVGYADSDGRDIDFTLEADIP